jgi:hypothetical protein
VSVLQLAITTRLHDVVVDTSVVPLDRPRVVGDADESTVSFPGPVIEIEPVEGGARIGPVLVKPGGQLTLDLGEVEVEFTVVRRTRLLRERFPAADVRMLVATGALLIFGMWWDTANRWAYTNPTVAAELEALPAMWERFRDDVREPAAAPSDALPPSVRFDDDFVLPTPSGRPTD